MKPVVLRAAVAASLLSPSWAPRVAHLAAAVAAYFSSSWVKLLVAAVVAASDLSRSSVKRVVAAAVAAFVLSPPSFSLSTFGFGTRLESSLLRRRIS